MPDLFNNPAFYGIQDLSFDNDRGIRVMYPTEENYVFDTPLLDGTYPLVVFAHGSRASSGQIRLCPEDESQDYKRWTSVLHLLARSGFIVAAPDLHRVLLSGEAASTVLEDTVRWMQREWDGRQVLSRPSVFVDPDKHRARAVENEDPQVKIRGLGMGIGHGADEANFFGMPTPVGLIGHSYGARAAALTAAKGNVGVYAYASIAGDLNDPDTLRALVTLRNTLFIAGALPIAGSEDYTILKSLWRQMAGPKSQVMLAGADHWSWFSPDSGLHPCEDHDTSAHCPINWLILGEVLKNFMAKQLLGRWLVPPYLLGSTGGHLTLMNQLWDDPKCALKVRWDDPLSEPSSGGQTYGDWPDAPEW